MISALPSAGQTGAPEASPAKGEVPAPLLPSGEANLGQVVERRA